MVNEGLYMQVGAAVEPAHLQTGAVAAADDDVTKRDVTAATAVSLKSRENDNPYTKG